MRFLDGPDRVLDSLVCAKNYLLGFFLRLLENLLLGLLYALQLFLVAFCYAVKSPVGILNLLKFLVQSPPVANNLPEVPLHADELLADPVLGIFDDVLREPHLPCELEREGSSGHSDVQFEKRLDLGGVKLHRAVHNSGVRSGGI